jgi:hypothetical protein
MAKKKHVYPGEKEAEKAKKRGNPIVEDEPDFIGNAPNYDKFHGWDVEEVLVWSNID